MRAMFRWMLVVALGAGGCGRRNFNDPDGGRGGPDAAACPASYEPQAGTNVAWGPADGIATWVSAQMSCLAQGTTLAVPQTAFEALALAEHVNVNAAWIGITAIDTPGTWSTPDGMPATFLPWNQDSSEPNSDGDCVKLLPNGKLGDENCVTMLTFACECRTP